MKTMAFLGFIVVTSIAGQATAKEQARYCQNDQIASTAPSDRYQQNDDGTVTDVKTTLVWHACLAGQHGKTCDEGTAKVFTWGEALLYPRTVNKNQSGWRLPNIRELESLVELGCVRPAINTDVFPNTLSSTVWSSSPYKFYPHYAWYVDFEEGIFSYSDRTDKKHLRLVRDGDALKNTP